MLPLLHALSVSLPLSSLGPSAKKGSRIRSSMDLSLGGFPYLSPRHRDLMVSLLSSVEARLGPHLLPSSTPPDVLSFKNQQGTSHGALNIRSGGEGSPVDFILESWLHCEAPMGTLNITTLLVFLNTSTDAPHLLMEFLQNSPTSLILLVDLLPRKDLVLYTDYLDEFYQDTHLDKQRQELEKLTQVLPYCSSSLYTRSILSPTAIAVSIDCREEGQGLMEEIIGVQIDSVAKEIVRIWLDKCLTRGKYLGETERADMLRRDYLIINKTVEIDLVANLPRLFGTDVATRVVGEIQKAFRI